MTLGTPNVSLPQLVHELVMASISQSPTRIAIRFGSMELTYQELKEKADNIAASLDENCVNERIIGISTRRGIDTITGVLGILLSGRAYLPLDPTYPADRLVQITRDAGIKTCLSGNKETNLFEGTALKTISYPIKGKPVSYNPHSKVDGLKGPGELSTGYINGSGEPPLAYILYTSGSTGKPKGVSMGHSPLVNLLNWQRTQSKAGIGTNTLQFAPLSFDVSFQEIFSTLSTGGTLILVEDDVRMDPFRLLAYIKDENINRIFLPFVALQQLAESAGANNYFPACLSEVMTAGEQLKITPQLVRLFSQIPGCKLFNQYGPTEAHVVTQLVLEGEAALWPALPGIGSPITNTNIYIVDENRRMVPAGETGELLIAGACLAEGYLNQPTLTASKFINWQHPQKGDTRVYFSGDLARYLPDGNIDFLGRIDDQVKIRGHRVEPAEVEVALNNYAGIEQAVVVARENKAGQKRLLAYIKGISTASIDINIIRKYLETSLPPYMVPSAIIQVDQFPKTKSGKIDKKSLPEMEIKRPELAVIYAPPSTESEIRIAGVWASLLEMDRIGINDDFFQLGGNSLLAVKTIVALRENYGIVLPVTRLYATPTIHKLASYIDHGEQEAIQATRNHNERSQEIAVIGLAGRFPGAATIEDFWQLLVNEKETTSFFSVEELDNAIPVALKNDPAYVKARGILEEVEMFDPGFFGINPRVAALMDPQQRLFMEISWEVLEKTGYLPARFDGTIGVFAGAGNNTYYLNNVQSNTELIDQVGAFQVMTANEKDYIATRTAFQLNLKGPAISLNTGCSTSLLTIGQAVENIRSGRCELAIAGGVAITVPLKSGHLYEEGAMLSRDGHCRPFDADAGGTVFSDGAGVVLLKPLDRAMADGDTIYGIIKGVGINNDGGDKSSFTAPSASGQAGAIRQAIDEAGIDASDITYIEAHGTATPLGDPIEIEGLKKAFGNQSVKQYCAIGSVKSNIGHLTAAAGVAGFIKTVLALYHKQIPASINFVRPNPEIDFAGSPFYVNNKSQAWTNEHRLAGVSSFGVGGTNVHIIIGSADEAPVKHSLPAPSQLIQFSAKTATSLGNYSMKLADHLTDNLQTPISDIAYSLRATRQSFNHRRFVVAHDHLRAIDRLRLPATPGEQAVLKNEYRHIAFVFPGQGAQFSNMGNELYEHQPVFKVAIDECAYLLYEIMNEDIRKIMFGNTANSEQINNTRYTQPAMFIFEYALAKLWISWGIKPTAFVGHSIGEFVAAHLAGVFNLADAIMLIEARGRLMADLPQGAMLSVLADSHRISSILTSGLSIAAINSSKITVVAGPKEDIAAFADLLEEAEIGNKRLITSHAFHSRMMEPVKQPFEKLVGTVAMKKPQTPIYSTVTGKLLTDSEAVDPAYWSHHLMATVRFADAVEHLLSGPPVAFLEIGPRNVATTLIKQQAGTREVLAIASQHPDNNGHYAFSELLHAVGQLWVNGIDIDFSQLSHKSNANRVDLPVYAFDKKRCWVDKNPQYRENLPMTVSQPTVAVDTAEVGLPAVNRKSSLIATIRQVLAEASGIDMAEVPANTGFIQAGLDSLLLTQVALTLKKRLAVPVSFRQLNDECNTIEKLAAFYDSKLPADPIINRQEISSTTTVSQPGHNSDSSIQLSLNQIIAQMDLLARQVALLQAQQGQPTIGQPTSESTAKDIPAAPVVAVSYRIEKEPPVAGARLGKDKDGNPAWFISNPNQPGQYLQLNKK